MKAKLIATKVLDGMQVHGSRFYDGYLWLSTRENPIKVYKVNIGDLSYEKIILTDLGDGEALEVAEDYIYVTATSHGKLVRINPDTLAWSIVVDFTGADPVAMVQTLAYYNGYLWVGGRQYMAKVDLSDFTYVRYDYNAQIDGESIHACCYGGGYIWATTSVGKILKINPADGAVADFFDLNEDVSDDICYYDGYLYVGTEEGAASKTYKFDGADLSSYTSVAETGDVYGVNYHDSHVLSALNVSPGQVIVRDLNLASVLGGTITFPTGFNKANEIVCNGDLLYVTCWTDPARILKYFVDWSLEANLQAYIKSTWTETDPALTSLKFATFLHGLDAELDPNKMTPQILIVDAGTETKHIISTTDKVTHSSKITVFVKPIKYGSSQIDEARKTFRNVTEEISKILREGRYLVEGILETDATAWKDETDDTVEPIILKASMTVKQVYYEG